MTQREIVRRAVRRQDPPRIAWDFLDPSYCDIISADPIHLINEEADKYSRFAEHEELMKKAAFHGEVRMDSYGNILGRLNGITKGECVLGALEKDWDALERYEFPPIDMAHVEKVKNMNLQDGSKYVLTGLPCSVFSTLRDLRKMDNALMDTVLEPESVSGFLMKVQEVLIKFYFCLRCF